MSNDNVRQRPCGFKLCPAFAVDGHEFCQVHSPHQILNRAKAIVSRHVAAAKTIDEGESSTPPTAFDDLLTKLCAAILRDLSETV